MSYDNIDLGQLNIGSGDDLFLDATNALPQPVLSYNQ